MHNRNRGLAPRNAQPRNAPSRNRATRHRAARPARHRSTLAKQATPTRYARIRPGTLLSDPTSPGGPAKSIRQIYFSSSSRRRAPCSWTWTSVSPTRTAVRGGRASSARSGCASSPKAGAPASARASPTAGSGGSATPVERAPASRPRPSCLRRVAGSHFAPGAPNPRPSGGRQLAQAAQPGHRGAPLPSLHTPSWGRSGPDMHAAGKSL